MPSGHIRLNDAIQQYLTSRRATCAITTVKQETIVARRFVSEIGNLYVENLRPTHVESFFASLLDDHVTRDGRTRPPISASTWNYLYARIKSLTSYLSKRGYTRFDLMEYVQPRRVEQRKRLQPSAEVMWAMLDAAKDERDRAFLATACNTGLRASTLADLRIGDVDLPSLNLRARITKSRTEDDMPITSDLAKELASWLRIYRAHQIAELDRVAQHSDYLFPARRSPTWRWQPGPNDSRDRVSVPGGWDPLRPIRKPHVIAQDALSAVGFPRLHEGVHTLRRGAARLLFDSLVEERGYDGALRVVSSFLHHTNVTTTERYLGLGQERRVRDLHLRGRSLLGPRPQTAGAQVVNMRAARSSGTTP